ncbi:MAG: NAD-binding protein [Lewinellaceae bacterium]|nr:NAD-binding protein [Lewinellaceae bacterium]
MKTLTNSWYFQILVLIVLGLRIGDVPGVQDTMFFGLFIFYSPVLLSKSIQRARAFHPATTKVLSVFLVFITLLLMGHSILGFWALEPLPEFAFHLLAGLVILIDISEHTFLKFYQHLHPALAFVSTFAGIILLGAFALMLPHASYRGVSFIDALFTSTSAVCVTGLAVLDTGKDFTGVGQGLILLLIQAGGIGILTFTNMFGILFKGEKSFRDLIFLTDLISADNLRHTFRSLVKIILFVFGVELIGALAVYYTTPGTDWFFAVFHSVSAFCNAGFSTFSSSLYDDSVRYNYNLQLVIAFLIITGGIGYNVFFNIFSVIRFKIRRALFEISPYMGKPKKMIVKWDLNTTLVIRTTIFLLLAGWVAFYFLEYDNTLKDHNWWGKIVSAFFGSVTPRTAGFNTVDIGAMAVPTLLIYLLLMWIGGSPGSTAGGIKTTTFAIATLNLFNQVRGKGRLVYKWRTISGNVISRITTIISLSLIAIGTATCLLVSFQPELDVMKAAFECFSAYGTVGLSMGITSQLCTANKTVIIILMFLGRVNFLTFLIAIFASISKPLNPIPAVSGKQYLCELKPFCVMKFVIIGLGNFGSSLGLRLIDEGHEVIGVDNRQDHVEMHKEKLTFVVGADTTEEQNIEKLPIEESDFVIISIGEDVGASLITTALVKRHYPHNKIIARGISYTHKAILETMNVYEIINPEEEYANQLAERFSLKGSLLAFPIDEEHEIVELDAPEEFVGRSVDNLDFGSRSLSLITILRNTEISNFLGKSLIERRSIGVVTPDTIILEGDILVLFARFADLVDFCNGK